MVDDDRRRTLDHGHPISSPCEPNGSGELKMKVTKLGIQIKKSVDFVKIR